MRNRLWALFDRLAWGLLLGTITNLLIECPPQHGKSEYWSKHFPAWWLRIRPDDRILLGSYAAGYAASWGRETRDVIDRHGQLIGEEIRDDVSGASEWKLAGRLGGMVTSGVEGGISGRPAELAIADDLLKDQVEAESKARKDMVWRWWESELSARLQKGGRRVLIMTRRAVDDPPGRIHDLKKDRKEDWTIITLPAIAEEDEDWPALRWNRKAGEALVPELHPVEELQAIKRSRDPHVWAGLYEQRPYPRGGGDLKSEWFKIVAANPGFSRAVRAWDLAASESPTAKRTAGVRMETRREGNVNRYHIPNIRYGRWNPGRRNEIILETAKLDGKGVPIILEREPGSGGMAQIDELKRMLDGWIVRDSPATGSKELRAGPLAGQASVGNVTILGAPWNAEFHAEVDAFPGGPTIDMVDAGAHAYNYLAGADLVVRTGSAPSAPSPRIFPMTGGRIL